MGISANAIDCTVRRKPYYLGRWRMPIRAGGVKFTQASWAALFILYAYGVISLFSVSVRTTLRFVMTMQYILDLFEQFYDLVDLCMSEVGLWITLPREHSSHPLHAFS